VSTGQLDTARRVMRRTLRILDSHARSGALLVGLEPSCTAALRTDVPDLVGDDPRYGHVVDWLHSHTVTFAEAVDRALDRDDSWAPEVGVRTLRQVHCHQHAHLGSAADRRVMDRLGIDNIDVPEGCCGLAGNFGFERGHFEVSMAVAEHALLPAVRAAPPDTVLLADGYSCRTQLDHATGFRGRHLAEVIDEALSVAVPAWPTDEADASQPSPSSG
jgi:Fe-S oxidoreductase